MANLREEVRASYDRQQAGLGDVGDVRHRLMHNALTAPVRDTHRLQWAAVIAAVLIAAIVITTFALFRGSFQPQPAPGTTRKAGASPTPLRNAINVPDSTALILYLDPANFNQIDGVTWTGTESGKVGLGASSGVVPNPAGTLYATTVDYRNRTGNVIAHMDPGAKYFQGTWADDELHYCQIVPFISFGGPPVSPTAGLPADGSAATLQLNTPGGTPRRVAGVGRVYQEAATYVAACSVQADRAVVVQWGGASQYWVLQLSTGRVLWTHSFGFNSSTRQFELVVASRDGQYVAEVHNVGTAAQPAFESTIYGMNGTLAGHVPGALQAFSWDGSLAVVGAKEKQLSVVRWRDSTVIWSAPHSSWYGGWARPEPGGSRIAVGAYNPTNPVSTSGPEPLDVYVVSGDGRAPFVWDGIYPV